MAKVVKDPRDYTKDGMTKWSGYVGTKKISDWEGWKVGCSNVIEVGDKIHDGSAVVVLVKVINGRVVKLRGYFNYDVKYEDCSPGSFSSAGDKKEFMKYIPKDPEHLGMRSPYRRFLDMLREVYELGE